VVDEGDTYEAALANANSAIRGQNDSVKKNPNIIVLRSSALDAKTTRAARIFVARISVHYPVSGAILFGSHARGHYRPDSDVDIAVLLPGHPGNFLDTKLALADIAYDVLLETGIRIQPLPIWEDEWQHPETYSNPRLLHNIDREGIRL
jgi:antitoxin ChpS